MMQADKPKYQLIIDDVLMRIAQGEYAEGAKLPSENQMSETYGVSVPTVRQALKELVYQNKIVRIKGNGSFVCRSETGKSNESTAADGQKSLQMIGFVAYLRNSNSLIMRIIRGAQAYLNENGYSMVVMFGDAQINSEPELVLQSLELGVPGVLLFAADPNANIQAVRRLESAGKHVVFLDRGTDEEPCALVASNNTDGAYRMTRHLLDYGHRNILYVSRHILRTTEKERVQGYRMAMRQAGCAEDQMLILDEVYEHAQEILAYVKNGVTAIQCVNDRTALWVIEILRAAGYKVPDDVSVSGFDGVDEGIYHIPPLTTIVQPFEEMGRTAAANLLRMINGEKGYKQTYLPVELLVNESTRALEAPEDKVGK